MKLLQAIFSEAPEALYPVDVVCAPRKLVLPMVNSIGFRVPDINEAVVAAPSVRVNDRLNSNATANNRLQSSLRAVGHDLRIGEFVLEKRIEPTGNCTLSVHIIICIFL
jgi:hypothetical protein